MRITLYIAIGVWLCVACGDDNNSATLIGATCKASKDCDPINGVCITSGKDGLCAEQCDDPGAANACPLGAYCDNSVLASDVQDAVSMSLCLPACKDKSDCRSGYDCTGVSSGPGKVCKPK
jgi:hypothetical protein